MSSEYQRLEIKAMTNFDPNSYKYQNVVASEAGQGTFRSHIEQ
jgi:hypothetical protein